MPEDALTNTFEERLLAQLRTELPPRAEAGRKPWLVAAAAMVAVTGTALAGLTMVQPAYAIEVADDGSLTVTMNSTDADDVAEAEADLRSRGVRIELVATTHDCLGVLGAPSVVPSHPPMTGPPSPDQRPELYAFDAAGDGVFVVRPGVIPADEVLWVALADDGDTLVTVADFVATGAPAPDFCG
ncbi:hypothetical protein [Micromonospora sagamiensis]|uniref:Uncharacterized protein n=1 Tax=Micromonospora sagamiensis TaxID=47875 RepID=A0A562WI05_9ACTN|nr:hypothetical protein [Micromonospora sagamiensis]TWJ29661.1 hypothetical protein JD81_03172 [Micromonospora sagamiensis]BCL17307.1 hypothetical protein GCM10017556_50460 [Micromonospora sagamiensis]